MLVSNCISVSTTVALRHSALLRLALPEFGLSFYQGLQSIPNDTREENYAW